MRARSAVAHACPSERGEQGGLGIGTIGDRTATHETIAAPDRRDPPLDDRPACCAQLRADARGDLGRPFEDDERHGHP